MRAWLAVPLLLSVLGCAGVAAWWSLRAPATTYRTAALATSDVRKLVTATGTLRAEVMVDVGTQVSGLVAELPVDFNDVVARDEVLARIDTALLEADVASARARLAEAEATRRRRQLELDRVAALRAQDAATDQELEVARAESAVAAAQVQTAEVTLRRAERNLGYATIRSPIDGIVVKRAVEVGQTVNAGFSAPTLFTLAGDLARMMILVRVDESDVGLVAEGGSVEFTVQSFPDRTFTGKVRQVRLESVLDQSVVTYTVVVDVENPDHVLLPGMTATVSFVVAEARDVVCAPNAALRFRPAEGAVVLGASEEPKRGRRGASQLYVTEGASLRALPVKTGIRGAECTEVSGEGVAAGLEVVTGSETEGATGTNPFSPAPSGGGRRPGGL